MTGEAPRFEMCPGLLETRFYAAHGIPAFAYGPGLLSVAHGPNEYVDLSRIVETRRHLCTDRDGNAKCACHAFPKP